MCPKVPRIHPVRPLDARGAKVALLLAEEKAGALKPIHVLEDIESFCWEYMRCLHPELTPRALKTLFIEGILQCYEEDKDAGK
jgi:hypothetical protein